MSHIFDSVIWNCIGPISDTSIESLSLQSFKHQWKHSSVSVKFLLMAKILLFSEIFLEKSHKFTLIIKKSYKSRFLEQQRTKFSVFPNSRIKTALTFAQFTSYKLCQNKLEQWFHFGGRKIILTCTVGTKRTSDERARCSARYNLALAAMISINW